jgi:hypothetical protein
VGYHAFLMGERHMAKGRSGVLLNLAVVFGGAILAVLLYAFVVRNWNGDVEQLRVPRPLGSNGGAFQVEIRNGCGIGGLAREAREYLRQHGFDVVESGNYKDFKQEHSRVIDRAGNLETAARLARILGIDASQVSQETTSEAFVDATVILGHDYGTLEPFVGNYGQ